MTDLCIHCHHRKITAARKLCRICYIKPAIRSLYPVFARLSQKPAICRHCNERMANRPLGLCYRDYENKEVRRQYQTVCKFGRRAPVEDFNGNAPLPEPCDCNPGSEEKIAVLARRVELRQSLHCPQERKFVRARKKPHALRKVHLPKGLPCS